MMEHPPLMNRIDAVYAWDVHPMVETAGDLIHPHACLTCPIIEFTHTYPAMMAMKSLFIIRTVNRTCVYAHTHTYVRVRFDQPQYSRTISHQQTLLVCPNDPHTHMHAVLADRSPLQAAH